MLCQSKMKSRRITDLIRPTSLTVDGKDHFIKSLKIRVLDFLKGGTYEK